MVASLVDSAATSFRFGTSQAFLEKQKVNQPSAWVAPNVDLPVYATGRNLHRRAGSSDLKNRTGKSISTLEEVLANHRDSPSKQRHKASLSLQVSLPALRWSFASPWSNAGRPDTKQQEDEKAYLLPDSPESHDETREARAPIDPAIMRWFNIDAYVDLPPVERIQDENAARRADL